MDSHVRQRRASENTVIHMKIPCSGIIGNADETLVKKRIPDPQIKRVEILENDAWAGRGAKARTQYRSFGKAVAEVAAPNRRGTVAKDDIGILVAGIEVVAVAIPGLIDRNRGQPSA